MTGKFRPVLHSSSPLIVVDRIRLAPPLLYSKAVSHRLSPLRDMIIGVLLNGKFLFVHLRHRRLTQSLDGEKEDCGFRLELRVVTHEEVERWKRGRGW